MIISRANTPLSIQTRAVDDKKDTTKNNSKFNSLQASKAKRVIENPAGKLDGKDFLKLFLESLKSQDPTSPVETKDMMIQTAQLTTVETNVANKKALETVTQTLTKNSEYQSQFGLIPAIGKLATLKDATLKYDGSNLKDFDLYFENEPKSGSIAIIDKNKKKVREISLLQYKNALGETGEDESGRKIEDSKGVLSFSWNGRRDNGSKLPKGKYTIKAEYVGEDSKKHTVFLGTNVVESVKFENSEPFLKLGEKYTKFSDIGEIR